MTFKVTTLNGVIYHKSSPNGGWGWVVLLSAFCIYGLAYGISKSLGIYFMDIKREFDVGNSETSWISSISFGSLGMAGLLISTLKRCMCVRSVIIMGGFLASVGMGICAFAPCIQLIFFGCFLSGIGYGFAFVAVTGQVSLYFGSFRPLATGIMLSGSSVSATFFPYMNDRLRQTFGWRNSFIILSGICYHVCALGALVRPISYVYDFPEDDEKTTSETSRVSICSAEPTATCENDVEAKTDNSKEETANDNRAIGLIEEVSHFLSKYWMALVLLFANTILDLSLFVPNVYLVPYAHSLGYNETQAALLLSFLSAGDILCRPLSGVLITWHNVLRDNLLLYVAALSFFFSFNQLLAVFPLRFSFLVVYTLVHGSLYGLLSTAAVTAVPTLMGSENIDTKYGVFFGVGSFALLGSAPLAGVLVDAFGDYNIAYWYCMACLSTTGFICLMSYLFVKMRGGVVVEDCGNSY